MRDRTGISDMTDEAGSAGEFGGAGEFGSDGGVGPDGGDPRGGGGRRRPKKRKKKHFFLNLVIAVLVIVGLYFAAVSDIFMIDKIAVKSSGRHFADSKIAGMSGIHKGDNLWKTRTGKAEERLKKDPYIADASIKRRIPGTIEITIKEREENYAIGAGDGFAVLDWSGMVLRHSAEAPGLPLIEGIEVAKAATGAAIEASRGILLADAVKLLVDAEKSGLKFKRLVITETGVKAYLRDTLCVKGALETVGSSIENVKLVTTDLKEQKIKRGTIIVSENGNITFSPEEQ
jgi:cell division protein FtsQ